MTLQAKILKEARIYVALGVFVSGWYWLFSLRERALRSKYGPHTPPEDRQACLSGAECGNIDACVKILYGNASQ